MDWHGHSVVSFAFVPFHVAPGVGVEGIELSLADGLHLLHDEPFDTLGAGWGSEGSIVMPELLHVD